MVYESSYESGRKPFTTDLKRGKWEKPTDFIFACCGLALKLDIFVIVFRFFFNMGIFGILPYYFYMALYMVPLLVIHLFMGQFSSSGFISAFRLSPFFKGLGYASVFLSTASLLFYAIFAIVPLIYIFNSLRPTLPWSCEGLNNVQNVTTLCDTHVYQWEVNQNYTIRELHDVEIHIPSALYFIQHFESLAGRSFNEAEGPIFSWSIIGYSVLVWGMIAGIFRYCLEADKFGRLLRYMILTALVLMVVCLVRFLFIPGALDGLTHYLKPRKDDMQYGVLVMTVVVLQAFGSGWGSVMSLSSFNDFKTNIMSYSWIIAFGQTLVYILFGMASFILQNYFRGMNAKTYGLFVATNWVLYISTASALATMKWANLWTILYYTMLLISSLVVMITQIFTILTSLFDEFEFLRQHKERVTFGFIGFLATCSLMFCTTHGVVFFSLVSVDSIVTYSIMHLLLILAVLWIYGRERFQRDIEFMLGQPFATWKIFLLRFIAPLFLLYTMVAGFYISAIEHIFHRSFLLFVSLSLVLLPLLFIPGYGMYITYRNTGQFCTRFRRACRPTDWYPQEMEDRQKYEETLGNSDITHQLYEVTEEDN